MINIIVSMYGIKNLTDETYVSYRDEIKKFCDNIQNKYKNYRIDVIFYATEGENTINIIRDPNTENKLILNYTLTEFYRNEKTLVETLGEPTFMKVGTVLYKILKFTDTIRIRLDRGNTNDRNG